MVALGGSRAQQLVPFFATPLSFHIEPWLVALFLLPTFFLALLPLRLLPWSCFAGTKGLSESCGQARGENPDRLALHHPPHDPLPPITK